MTSILTLSPHKETKQERSVNKALRDAYELKKLIIGGIDDALQQEGIDFKTRERDGIYRYEVLASCNPGVLVGVGAKVALDYGCFKFILGVCDDLASFTYQHKKLPIEVHVFVYSTNKRSAIEIRDL